MYTATLAVGLTLSNNLEAIAVSKGASEIAGYVAISSVATCIGCILGGHAGWRPFPSLPFPSLPFPSLPCPAGLPGWAGLAFGFSAS